MSGCRHTAPLLTVLRFGGADERAQRHVAHLEFCAVCQAAVADDRALARQVERALRARVDGFVPSSAAWAAVQRRVVDEPPRWRARWARWLALPTGGLASAGAVSALALVLLASGQGGTGSVEPAASAGSPESAASTGQLPLDERSGLPRRSSMLPPARTPAEPLAAPSARDVTGTVMDSMHARPDNGREFEVLQAAAALEKRSVSHGEEGGELVAYGGIIVAYFPPAE